jgi:hypothetical protein
MNKKLVCALIVTIGACTLHGDTKNGVTYTKTQPDKNTIQETYSKQTPCTLCKNPATDKTTTSVTRMQHYRIKKKDGSKVLESEDYSFTVEAPNITSSNGKTNPEPCSADKFNTLAAAYNK